MLGTSFTTKYLIFNIIPPLQNQKEHQIAKDVLKVVLQCDRPTNASKGITQNLERDRKVETNEAQN